MPAREQTDIHAIPTEALAGRDDLMWLIRVLDAARNVKRHRVTQRQIQTREVPTLAAPLVLVDETGSARHERPSLASHDRVMQVAEFFGAYRIGRGVQGGPADYAREDGRGPLSSPHAQAPGRALEERSGLPRVRMGIGK